MKKIYFLLVAILVTSLSFGQELVVNGDLESWDGTNSTFTGWLPSNYTQETTDIHGGTYAAKRDGTVTSGTAKLRQTFTVTGGDNYTVNFWYNVISERTSGTATHSVRIYSTWKDASSIATTVQTNEIRAYPSGYTIGQWVQYTATFNAPADADTLDFSLRAYSDSTIIFDDISFMHNAVSLPGLTITSPSDGDVLSLGDVTVNYAITNFVVATMGSGDGHFHWYLDGADQGPVYADTGSLTITGLTAGAHSVAMDLRENNATHDQLSPPVATPTINFTISATTVFATIAEIRADAITNGVGGFYELSGTPTVTYARTGPNSRNQKYIQDGTGAILIDDQPEMISTTFVAGDGMSGLKGQTSIYNGVLQFRPSQDASVVVGTTITPAVVTVADIDANQEMYESELVKIQGVTFTDAGTAFAVNTNYDFSDGVNTMAFRSSFSEADYVVNTDNVPSGTVDIIVFVGEYNGTPQVVARSLADLTADVSENTIQGFEMYPNPVNGDVLNITTLQGLDKNISIYNILGKQVLAKTITGSTLNVSNLNTGIYLIKVEEAGNFTTRKLVIK